jgi:hypothetical protein
MAGNKKVGNSYKKNDNQRVRSKKFGNKKVSNRGSLRSRLPTAIKRIVTGRLAIRRAEIIRQLARRIAIARLTIKTADKRKSNKKTSNNKKNHNRKKTGKEGKDRNNSNDKKMAVKVRWEMGRILLIEESLRSESHSPSL